MNNPCYGCQERTVYCHAACDRYKRFSDFREVVRHRKHLVVETYFPTKRLEENLKKIYKKK